jgi:hypothetical protein
MLNRSIALAGAAALMIVLGAPSASGASAPPARAANVTNVRVVWADAKQHRLRITWTESQPAANTIVLRNEANEGGNEFGHTTADQPNVYVVDASTLGPAADPADKVWIQVGDGSGTPGRTEPFDRFNNGGYPVTTSFEADGSLRWTVAPDTSVDATPNDQLDRPADYTYTPQQRVRTDNPSIPACDAVHLAPTTALTGTIPDPGHLYNLSIVADNEWGTTRGNLINIGRTTSLTMDGPPATRLGEKTTLTGVLHEAFIWETMAPPSCGQWPEQVPGQSVVIQQRTAATAPWTTAGTTTTIDAWGKYVAVLTNRGHREYRAVRLNTVTPGWRASYGMVGGSKAVRTTSRVVSAKFIQPVIKLGTRPQAYLWVDPAGAQKAALQFKNASGAWQGVSYKTLYAGRGLLAFQWNKRGATQFRWWVPATATADATYSGVFTLTVR